MEDTPTIHARIQHALAAQYPREDIEAMLRTYRAAHIQSYIDTLDHIAHDKDLDLPSILDQSPPPARQFIEEVIGAQAFGPITVAALIHTAYAMGHTQASNRTHEAEATTEHAIKDMVHRYLDILQHPKATPASHDTGHAHAIVPDIHPIILRSMAQHILEHSMTNIERARWLGYIQAALIAHERTTLVQEEAVARPLFRPPSPTS